MSENVVSYTIIFATLYILAMITGSLGAVPFITFCTGLICSIVVIAWVDRVKNNE